MTEEIEEVDAADIVQEDIADAEDGHEDGGADKATAPEWSAEDEEEARLFGWKSPDEWQGDKPAGYIGKPDEFLERVQRSRIFKTMQEKLQSTESQAAELARKQEAMNQRAIERQREIHEAEMQRISAAQRRAVDEADTETYDRLEAEKRGLAERQQTQQEQHQPPPRTTPDPFISQYRDENDWAKDPILWREASQVVDMGIQAGIIQTDDPRAQIELVERTFRNKYPHMFQSKDRPAPAPQRVDGGGLASGGGARASGAFAKLPGDAKASFTRFVKEGLYKDTKEDREEFANEYNAA